MPFIPHTPESLIKRSDSKDPATTCKGLTVSGRPCRRPIGVSPQPSPSTNGKSRNGVVAFLEAEDDEHDGAAAFFCWQHQDQADVLASSPRSGRGANIVSLQERTSIDTLAERLGIMEVGQEETPSRKSRQGQNIRVARKETLPRKWQDVDGPLLAVNSGGKRMINEKKAESYHSKGRSTLGLFCCIRSVDQEPSLPPPVRRNPEKAKAGRYEASRVPMSHYNRPRRSSQANQARNQAASPVNDLTLGPALSGGRLQASNVRPFFPKDRPSQAENLLSLIPKSLSPQTTALLLGELAKPISQHDEEGFIYMFWLTDASSSIPEPRIASSLLADDSPSTPNGRRKSDFIQTHATRRESSNTITSNPTILLKIGRASNVQRRLNEWTRQCGHNLSLIRYYPHTRSSHRSNHPSPPASPSAPSKVRHAHKVERLIHLELADQRVRQSCDSCGKEHREWFEVESSRQGLRGVDETIRRWTTWGQNIGR